eukprot:gene18711-biopygen17435
MRAAGRPRGSHKIEFLSDPASRDFRMDRFGHGPGSEWPKRARVWEGKSWGMGAWRAQPGGSQECYRTQFSRSWPGQTRPDQAGLGQARPGQARPGQARPGQARPGQAGPATRLRGSWSSGEKSSRAYPK